MSQLPDGTYEVGTHLGRLVGATAPEDPLITLAEPYVRSLRDTLDESVGVVSVVGRSRMCVLGYPSNQPERFVYEPYVKRRLHAGASGKVLLAFGAPALRRQVLQQPLESYTDATLTSPGDLLVELAQVQSHGWAISRGERCAGSVAVAVPLRDPNSGRVHSLTVLAPDSRFDDGIHEKWVASLQETVASIEDLLSA